jgi:hypothetical protein
VKPFAVNTPCSNHCVATKASTIDETRCFGIGCLSLEVLRVNSASRGCVLEVSFGKLNKLFDGPDSCLYWCCTVTSQFTNVTGERTGVPQMPTLVRFQYIAVGLINTGVIKTLLRGIVLGVSEADICCGICQISLCQTCFVAQVPRVFVGGKCIGGGSETWSLHNQGRLLPLLKEAGASFKKSD